MTSLLLLTVVLAQPTPPASPLEAPKNWAGETIRLPPSFAPQLGLKGWEHIRFAPEMFDEKSDRFFSYIVLFDVEKLDLDEKKLSQEILIYYRGLANAVSRGSIDTKPFQLRRLEPSDAQVKADSKLTGTVHRFQLSWVEPFRTKKAQTLFLQTQVLQRKNGTEILFTVSSAGWDHAVWKDLNQIRDAYLASRKGKE